jgi:beta-lactamase regulating signal transducer with metallopeptidase domain
MDWLLPLAAKSFVIAGATLLLLQLLRKRSAADRSWVAHLGLAALAFLPVVTFALPALEVAGPDFMAAAPAEAATTAPAMVAAPKEVLPSASSFPVQAQPLNTEAPVDWAFWGYVAPAALLVLFTLIALLRLVPLKSRANVLVEPHWLSALAHAQRRMGFKNGTALLTSDDIRSPISWGLLRPTILLNKDAAEARDEAEAIIAHELAHVARLDWAKLVLSRVTTAIFWFNPLVWLLAREAHQLREEAADDAVLASNIEDTEYARLLVGIARHECRGFLIGAHGVAPAANSLSRRVRRVLDAASHRAPGGWRWTAAAGFFAAGMAVPVAALQIVAPTPAAATLETAQARKQSNTPYYVSGNATAGDEAADLDPDGVEDDLDPDLDVDVDVDVDLDDKIDRAVAAAGADTKLAMAVAARAAREANRAAGDLSVDDIIAASVHGITPAYISEMRRAAPQLANADVGDFIAMKIQGVTPDYIRGMSSVGIRGLNAETLIAMGVHGVSPAYVRAMGAAGYRGLDSEELIALKVQGVTPEYARSLQQKGYGKVTTEQLIQLKVHGVGSGDGDP